MRCSSLLLAVMAVAFIVMPATATVIHVPGDYGTIQAGINASVDGDTVLVAAGTYYVNINFSGKRIVLLSQSGREATILEPGYIDHSIVTFENGEDTTAVLKGFTIRNTDSAPGINISDCGPVISNNIITDNQALGNGGGICASNANMALIRDNIFENNRALGNGGAIYCMGGIMVVSGNIFSNNIAFNAGSGGAIYIGASNNSVVDHNLFISNYCERVGGAVILSMAIGGAVFNNTFDSNSSSFPHGAGISLWYSSNIHVYNNIVVNSVGIGIYGYETSNIFSIYNDVWNNMVDYTGIIPGEGSISADPLFVGGDPYSYELGAGSPCIDAGDPDSPPDSNGTRADMGYLGSSRGVPNFGRVNRVPSEFSTIQAAIDASEDLDTVLVAPGTYQEHISFLGKPILVTSEAGPEVTIIEKLYNDQPIVRFENNESAMAELRGFTIRNSVGAPAININYAAATVSNSRFVNNNSGLVPGGAIRAFNAPLKRIYVKNSVFEGNSSDSSGGAIYGYGTNVILNENTFRLNSAGADGGALFLWGSYSSSIDHNLWVNNHCQSIGGAIGLYYTYGGNIFNNTLDSNSTSGQHGGGIGAWNTSNIHFYNNINVNGGGAGFYFNSIDNITITYNDVWNNTTDYAGITPGIGSISADPLFAGGDPYSYELGAGSPCIDAGDPGSPRDPDGSIIDMGCLPDTGDVPHSNRIIHVPADFPNVQAGINGAVDGDTVLVAPGTYEEIINFNGRNIIVASNYLLSGDTTDISATKLNGQFFASYPVVSINQNETSDARLIGFDITHGKLGVSVWHASPQILNNIIELGVNQSSQGYFGGGICCHGGVITVIGNTIRNCFATGAGAIWADSGCTGTIHHNVIVNNITNRYAGALSLSGTGAVSIYNNTVCYNQGPGGSYESYGNVYIENASAACSVYNNIIAFNTSGLARIGTADIVNAYNNIFGNSERNYYNCSPGTGEISLDPELVRTDPDDYRIYAFSPCVNAGDPSSPLDPDSTRADMGALWPPVNNYGHIAGTLIDSEGSPVAEADLYLIGTAIQSQSDSSGNFIMRVLADSQLFDLVIVHQGFADTSISGISITVGDTVQLGSIVLRVGIGSFNYVSGDINADGDATPLSDVIYGNNFFHGGLPPVSMFCTDHFFYAASDVNSSCTFNGLDITYLIWHWSGGGSFNLMHCQTCPSPLPDPFLLPSGIDPGSPDSIYLGYLDNSVIRVYPGCPIGIPIRVKNDEPAWALNLSLAADTAYFPQWLDVVKFNPISGWNACNILPADPNRPVPGYSTKTLMGWKILPNDGPCLNSHGEYMPLAIYGVTTSSDMGHIGDTTRVIPGSHSRSGVTAFCDSAGLSEWSPAISGGLIEFVSGPPDISLLDLALVDTVPWDQTLSREFCITDSGPADLFHEISADQSWITVSPGFGLIHASGTDTVIINYHPLALFPGVYSAYIRIASNDPADSLLSIPVTLHVVGQPYGWLEGTVTNQWSVALAGAIVRTDGSEPSDTTDEYGHYLLERVTSQSHNISFSYPGYADTTVANFDIPFGDTAALDVSMRMLEAGIIHIPADYATIQEGIEAASEGGVVLVSPGTYVVNLDYLGKNIVVASESGPEVTFLNPASTDLPIVSFISGESVQATLSGFTITGANHAQAIIIDHASATVTGNIITNNGSVHGHDGPALCLIWGDELRLTDNLISDNYAIPDLHGGSDGAVSTYGHPRLVISGNRFINNDGLLNAGALFLGGGFHVDIHHNLFYLNRAEEGSAILASDPDTLLFHNNTLVENWSATQVGGAFQIFCNRVPKIYNNIIVNNTGRGIKYENFLYPCTTYYNDVWGNTVNYELVTPGEGSISTDPLFNDPNSCELSSDSPCIDTGDPNSPLDPDGTRADMGAFYFNHQAGGCAYVVGDANGNGVFNGLDVTYGVAYFKGGPPPPINCDMCPEPAPFYAGGDVNGSCSYNGLDITYMVAYFKGGPLPHPCPDCPPAELLAPPTPGESPIPAVRPILVPTQKARSKAGSVE